MLTIIHLFLFIFFQRSYCCFDRKPTQLRMRRRVNAVNRNVRNTHFLAEEGVGVRVISGWHSFSVLQRDIDVDTA